jgi:hypothetical protein
MEHANDVPSLRKKGKCVETIQGLPKLEIAWLRNSPDHKLERKVVKTIVVKVQYLDLI